MAEEQNETIEKILRGEGMEDKAGESEAMIRHQSANNQAFKYLVDVDKKTQLNELLMRTVFVNREELILLNDYVSWLEDFGLPLDGAIRYCAARPAVGGLSREQLVKSLNPFSQFDNNKKHRSGSDGNEKNAKRLPG